MENKRTSLYDKHVALGAQMIAFGGFDMPLVYSTIIDEHNAVRNHCGVFDVSHMGEIFISGKDAEKYVNYIYTNDVSGADIHQVFYGMLLYPDGGTVDDMLVYKMKEDEFLLVTNAANDDKDFDWVKKNADGFDVEVNHRSDEFDQLAVQGPEAESVVESVLGIKCRDIKYYTAETFDLDNGLMIVSRTGYTGEDGFEIYAPHDKIIEFWDKLMASKKAVPCGLGSRDTLRFEAGLPLYGNELSKEISPIMAGLSFFCKLDKPDFIGKDAIAKQKEEGVEKRIAGIELKDNAIPRNGYPVLRDGKEIGVVTTGYHSITLDKSLAYALVDKADSKLGTEVEIKIRKKVFPGTIVKKRFYQKEK